MTAREHLERICYTAMGAVEREKLIAAARAYLAEPVEVDALVREALDAVAPIRKDMEEMAQRAEDKGWHLLSTGRGLVQYVERLASALADSRDRERAALKAADACSEILRSEVEAAVAKERERFRRALEGER